MHGSDTKISEHTGKVLDHLLATEQSQHRLPSVVAGVVRDGALVWSGATGTLNARAEGPQPNSDTQYRIGSITKTFVAVEIMRLRDEGRLAIADPITVQLPELKLPGVSIAQLLTHTSGIQAETEGPWWERAEGTAHLDRISLRFAPGTHFHYSNVGYALLGQLIERVRGVPWHEAVTSGILAPLGMTRTTTRPQEPYALGLAVHPFADVIQHEPEHDAGIMAPAGQFWSTIADLAIWAAFCSGRTVDVLAPESLKELLCPVALNDTPHQPWDTAHGLGWQVRNVDGRRFAGHGGSVPGFLARMWVDLESGDGAIACANATSGLGDVTQDLLRRFAELEPRATVTWSADISQVAMLDLVGDWFWGPYRFTASAQPDGGIRLGDPGTNRGSDFIRGGEGWVGQSGYYAGEPLTVVHDANGQAIQLDLASFAFTRTPYDPNTNVPGGSLPWT